MSASMFVICLQSENKPTTVDSKWNNIYIMQSYLLPGKEIDPQPPKWDLPSLLQMYFQRSGKFQGYAVWASILKLGEFSRAQSLLNLVPLLLTARNWWFASWGGHLLRHQLGELDKLALRSRHGSMDPIAAIALAEGVHNNNNKKKLACCVFLILLLWCQGGWKDCWLPEWWIYDYCWRLFSFVNQKF